MDRTTFMKRLGELALLTALVLTKPLTVRSADSGPTAIVVTIDGTRLQDIVQWNARLLSWADSVGSYVPDVVNLTRGVTDPNHAVLWGSGDPGQCLNWEGNPDEPMHPELLRKQRGLPEPAVAILSAKAHCVLGNVHSRHPDYGEPYQATALLVQTPGPACILPSIEYQGPDSVTTRAAIEFLAANDVTWMGLNLSEYDFMTHRRGMVCCDWDTVCYWQRAEAIYREAERLIIEELWPFLQSDPRYSGRTLLVVTTDHGRHDDSVSTGFLDHGHGWLADSTACALNCAGCRDAWSVIAGPGIRQGYVADGTYTFEDVAATVRSILEFKNPFERGVPITEIMEGTTRVSRPDAQRAHAFLLPATPNPFTERIALAYRAPSGMPVRLRIIDTAGRSVRDFGSVRAVGDVFSVSWEGTDNAGRHVPAGVYFCTLEAEGSLQGRKVTLVE